MDRPERSIATGLCVLATLCAVAGGLLGLAELALYLTPCFLLVAVLLSGRFVGEDAIARRRRPAAPPPARHVRPRWASPVLAPVRSRLGRCPASLRGPPACAPLAA